MDKLEFRIKLSKDDMEWLRNNSYLIDECEDVSDIDILKDAFGLQFIKDDRFGGNTELESLEIEEIGST